jgi:L-asparaginase
MAIRLLVTGGTFDKEYNELDGSLVFQDSHVKEMLSLGRCRVPIKVRTLMMVDSLEMSDVEREVILQNCRLCDEEHIIVTHGTDTMEVTARYLGAEIKNKTVILAGAMIPYTFGSSDGLFNLGAAIAFVQTMPHGVYVAMNGRVFPYDQVKKNRKIGEFEEIDPC